MTGGRIADRPREAHALELEVVAEGIIEVQRCLTRRTELQRDVGWHAVRLQMRLPLQQMPGQPRDLEVKGGFFYHQVRRS